MFSRKRLQSAWGGSSCGADSADFAGAGATKGSSGFGQGASRRDDVVDDPDAGRQRPGRLKGAGGVAASFDPVESRLTGRVSNAPKCRSRAAASSFSRDFAGQRRGGIEAALPQSGRVQGNRNHQVGSGARDPSCCESRHCSHDRFWSRVESSDSLAGVLESLDPVQRLAIVGCARDAGAQWRGGRGTSGADFVGRRDGCLLAEPAAAICQPRQLVGAGAAQGVVSGPRQRGRAGRATPRQQEV